MGQSPSIRRPALHVGSVCAVEPVGVYPRYGRAIGEGPGRRDPTNGGGEAVL